MVQGEQKVTPLIPERRGLFLARARAAFESTLNKIVFMKLKAAFGSLLVLALPYAHAATVPSGFTDEVVVTGLTSPTAMAFAPDGRLFVCQQGGQLRVIKNGVLLATPF